MWATVSGLSSQSGLFTRFACYTTILLEVHCTETTDQTPLGWSTDSSGELPWLLWGGLGISLGKVCWVQRFSRDFYSNSKW